ncbi:NAD-dependent epimerase/dehydratase family protein [Cryobacterium tagatosivorans]|uniref:NAD-dependent epimerase/dehydratase family protein n=1 Tax=Cryobacterium tagatosivorans TaxID=1259199 RepID=A0A4R8UEW2_9MICO|nr:NAD-dependent epimerase/dehydratase family protein [Cryobacterium tagatosivorans]TFB49902.1 NAD-dependent epimerase/dehydratase family protein [Cryobacterium tagatosivorans]
MAKTALIIGGTGQIGLAAASRLASAGWAVTVAHRGQHTPALPADARSIRFDRADTAALHAAARGHDLVLDTVAYDTVHADQLAGLAGHVGSLVVISTGSVYLGRNGSYLDVATDEVFPDFPVPLTEADPAVDNAEQTYSPLKAAMERRLLAAADLPVSILRPGAIHGPNSPALREWFFIKRVLDGRRRAVLAYDGASRFGTSATANIAELVFRCAERPGRRVLNAVDDEALTVAGIGRAVFDAMGHEAEILTFTGPPLGELGSSPWGIPNPIVLSMAAAREQLGYAPAVSYAEGLADDIRWVTDAVASAERRGGSWQQLFPSIVNRYGANGWFPYAAEDSFAG